jgi:phospholipid/cholesterol/gamma-HCH transport system permease protein
MDTSLLTPAAATRSTPQELALSGAWTRRSLGTVTRQLDAVCAAAGSAMLVDAARISALDTAGAWVLQKLLRRLHEQAVVVSVRALRPEFARLLEVVGQAIVEQSDPPARSPSSKLAHLGRSAAAVAGQSVALLGFIGEFAFAFAACIARPSRFRWRPMLFNLRRAGFDALPIVGLLSFLLGVVVAYQGAGQLRQYGATIFIADLVGLSMLREFSPLITAIIIAGRSGSAYAAQIGSMSVSEEIDPLR